MASPHSEQLADAVPHDPLASVDDLAAGRRPLTLEDLLAHGSAGLLVGESTLTSFTSALATTCARLSRMWTSRVWMGPNPNETGVRFVSHEGASSTVG